MKAEIFSNKARIFNNLFYYYFSIGLLFLILLFVQSLSTGGKLDGVVNVFYWLIVLGFMAHVAGLILLWYVSGHAPWSNAYESMVYIGWATMLSGFIFGRKSKITLATTALLTSFISSVCILEGRSKKTTIW